MAWFVAGILFLAALFPVLAWITGWQSLPDAIRSVQDRRRKVQPKVSTAALRAAPTAGEYRALRETVAGVVPNELLEIAIDGELMTVVSPEWVSTGKLRQGVYVGRFKYHRGETPKDTGTHELSWNGSEFRGLVRFDHPGWGSNDLVWRPQ